MRQLLLLCALIAACNTTKAQTVDTSIKSMCAVKIVPVRPNFNDTTRAYWLGAAIVTDDLQGSAVVRFVLINRVKTTDNPFKGLDWVENTVYEATVTIDDTAYASYQANKLSVFTYLASSLGLTLKQ